MCETYDGVASKQPRRQGYRWNTTGHEWIIIKNLRVHFTSLYFDVCLLFAIIKHWEISWEKINILSDLQKWFKRLNYHHQLLDRWNSILKKPSVSHFAPWVWPCFLNSVSNFQSTCYSTYIEMTGFLPHVMHSHMEYQCIFMWALNWYLFCCSRIGIDTCAETGILESSDEAISIWMAVSLGQFWYLQGTNTLSATKVKTKRKSPQQGAQYKPSFVFSFPGYICIKSTR